MHYPSVVHRLWSVCSASFLLESGGRSCCLLSGGGMACRALSGGVPGESTGLLLGRLSVAWLIKLLVEEGGGAVSSWG